HLGAKGLHQLAGKVRADAFDHPGAEVLLDAFQRRGRHDTQLRRLELQAMRPVGDPPARAVDIFPWGDGRRRAQAAPRISPCCSAMNPKSPGRCQPTRYFATNGTAFAASAWGS